MPTCGRDPLLAPAIAFACGVAAARLAGLDAGPGLAAAAALAACAVAARCARSAWLLHGCVWLAIAAAGSAWYAWRQPPPAAAPPLEPAPITGCIDEPPVITPDRAQFTVALDGGPRARITLPRRGGEPLPALAYGRRIAATARLRLPRNYLNPGSFDHAGYLARQGIDWTGSIPARTAVTLLPEGCGRPWHAFIFGLRSGALRRLERIYPEDNYAQGVMKALLLGDNSQLEAVWIDHYRRTGTYHAIVISGAHISAVAGLLLWALRLAGGRSGWGLLAAGAAAWLYTLVAGAGPPVARAAAGFTLYLAGAFLFRRPRVLNLLAATSLAFLIADPAQLFDASFQLSFLSVAAIGAFAAPLMERSSSLLVTAARGLGDSGRDPRLDPRAGAWRVELRLLAETLHLAARLPRAASLALVSATARAAALLFDLAFLSFVVQAALALPMAAYFHRLSLSGLSANVPVGFLLTAAIPADFAAIFTGWHWIAAPAAGLLEASRRVVAWHAAWEPNWRIPDPPLWLGAAFLAALALAAWRLRRGGRWQPWTATALALLAVIVIHPFEPQLEPATLEIAALDVGQGDSIFVALPSGQTMLVDGGGLPAFARRPSTRFDTGEDIVSPYLWSRGLRRLDIVVATHAHDDHAGGLPAVIANFRPRELWAGVMPESPAWTRIRDAAVRAGTRIRFPRAGEVRSFAPARVEVLAPPSTQPAGVRPHNNDSLVLRLIHGRHAALLTGDIEAYVETQLRQSGAPLAAAILKAPHHGSRYSNSPAFLAAVHPAVALFSVGFENSYHLPHPAVVERLAAGRTLILRTDRDGLSRTMTDGRTLTVEP